MSVPTFNITDATNAAPIVITTSADHGYSTGDFVIISSVGGNTAANGTWGIKVRSSTTFDLVGSSANAAYTSGGTALKTTIDTSKAVDGPYTIIKHETTTTGTGTITLGDVVSGYMPASIMDDGATVTYRIETVDGSDVYDNGDWETGQGTYDKAAGTITRDACMGSSAAAGDNLLDAFVSFAAGTKTIRVAVDNDASKFGDTFPVSAPGNASIAPLCDGIMCGGSGNQTAAIVNNLVRTNAHRECTNDNIVALCPVLPAAGDATTFTGTIRLFWAKQVVTPAGLIFDCSGYVDMPLCRITETGRRVAMAALDMSQPSPIPFQKNANKIPAQDKAYANRPVDVFAYATVLASTGPNWIAPEATFYFGISSGNASLRLFYLNWYSGTARNNGNSGSPVGHDIWTDSQGWTYLDAENESGWSSSWITDTRFGFKVKRRYLYLGTIVPHADGRITCTTGYRGIWNRWKRRPYTDTRTDTTNFWDFTPITESSQDWTIMNPGGVNPNGTPWSINWRHLWINPFGQEDAVPKASARITTNGNVRVSMVSALSSGWVLLRDSNNTQAITADAANDDTGLLNTNFEAGRNWKTIQDTTTWRSGANVYVVQQARGTANNAAIVRTKRFFGHNRPIVFGDPGVVNPLVGNQAQNAGPATFTVEGEC